MQLIRDNLTLWTSELADDAEGGEGGDKWKWIMHIIYSKNVWHI